MRVTNRIVPGLKRPAPETSCYTGPFTPDIFSFVENLRAAGFHCVLTPLGAGVFSICY